MHRISVSFYEMGDTGRKILQLCAYVRYKAKGGGLKALVDMSAKHVSTFGSLL